MVDQFRFGKKVHITVCTLKTILPRMLEQKTIRRNVEGSDEQWLVWPVTQVCREVLATNCLLLVTCLHKPG